MKRLWINISLYSLYVLLLWGAGGWFVINYVTNVAVVWFVCTAWTIMVIASGLVVFGKR